MPVDFPPVLIGVSLPEVDVVEWVATDSAEPGNFGLRAELGAAGIRLRGRLTGLSLERADSDVPGRIRLRFPGARESAGVLGTWQPVADRFAIIAGSPRNWGTTETLDGILALTEPAGEWMLDAVYSSSGAQRVMLARVRLRLAEAVDQTAGSAESGSGRDVVVGDLRVPSYYHVWIEPEIDGVTYPGMAGDLGFPGLQPRADLPSVMLSTTLADQEPTSDPEATVRPGQPFWFAGSEDDAEVDVTGGTVSIRLGPEHADGSLPTWEIRSAPSSSLDIGWTVTANEGRAEFTVHGDRISGVVSWHHNANSPRDRASEYRARITGSLVADPISDSTAADLGESSLTELRPGQVGNSILQPFSVAFDVLVRGADLNDEPALPGVLIIAPADLAYRKLNLGLYMTAEVQAGFVSWSIEGLATDRHVADCALFIDGLSAADDPTAPGGSLHWYTSPGHYTFASAVRCELSYDPSSFAVTGTLSAVSADGQRLSATLSGERRGRDVEELRHRLARSSLAGNWTGVLGPVGRMSLPPDSGVVVVVSAETDEPAGGPAGQPKLIRLAIGPGLAIGLTWNDSAGSSDAELIVLARNSPQFDGLEAIGPEQRTELKSLAYALEQDARYAEGLPVGRHAAHLYSLASARSGAWTTRARSDLMSAMRMVLMQLSCALALGNYPLMLTVLTEAIDYARRSRDLAGADTPRSDRASLTHPEIPIRSLEAWRGRLDEDADRIAAVTAAGPFYALLAEFFNEQEAPGDALVAAELGRARAFADLLHETPWSPSRLFFGSTPRFTGTRLRAVLASLDQTVVEYQLHDDRLLIWVATPAGDVRSVPVPSGAAAAVPDAVARYQALVEQSQVDPLASADRVAMDAVLTELGELLWNHIPRSWLPDDPDQVITVVPHGAALRAPFPALLTANGSYLIERHAIALSPALALLPELTRRRELAQAEVSGPRLLALVDPWPLPENPLPDGESFSRVGLIGQLFDEIAALYPDAEVLSGANATVAAFLQPAVGATRPTVVHFGTHAVALEGGGSDPLDSFVALAPDPDRDQDGRLLARSVLAATIPGDIVVLSACATGRGEITGDGVAGLSRAFLSSGPTTLVLTLCEITEGASLELTYEFHRQLLAEQCGPALAIARAARRHRLCDRPARLVPFRAVRIGLGEPHEH